MSKEIYKQNADRVSNIDLLDSLSEECAELIQSISKVKRVAGHGLPTDWTKDQARDSMIEELAHVTRACDSVIYKLNIDPKDIRAQQDAGDKLKFDQLNKIEAKEA